MAEPREETNAAACRTIGAVATARASLPTTKEAPATQGQCLQNSVSFRNALTSCSASHIRQTPQPAAPNAVPFIARPATADFPA
jgi:hypothetical protein